jgi:thiol:disulfide interchange protein
MTVMLVVLVATAAATILSQQNPKTSSKSKGLVRWIPTFEAAMQEAKATGKKVLLEFSMNGCGACDAMETTTFADPNIKYFLESYVTARVNTSEGQEDVAAKFNVDAVPALFILSPDGKVIAQKTGYQSANELQTWMEFSTK